MEVKIQHDQRVTEFAKWAFYGIVGFCAIFAVSILSKMNENIGELNTKIAVVFEVNKHLEYRVQRLEDKNK